MMTMQRGTLDLSAASATLSESGPAITLTVDRTGGSDGTVTVDYATADVTANAPGDYQALSGTLTFLNGELSKTLTLTPNGDTVWEPNEDFTLTLSNVVDAILGTQTSTTVTITDDDPAPPAGAIDLSGASFSVSEAGPALEITVNRSGGSFGTVTVDYTGANGSATSPADFDPVNGTLTFLDGVLTQTIMVTPVDDTTWE
ncbi:Calx-beta domain-containing protein, partial [endosymbiont of Lamellibrachia barhami]|uniref:Calx-beta domain-containing protein n=1 Tax=endosymbiont of Lamellibrachia barhami TaxID=205975 RepID=UPI00248419A5